MEIEAMRRELREVIDNGWGDEALLQKIYDVINGKDEMPEERMRLIKQERRLFQWKREII